MPGSALLVLFMVSVAAPSLAQTPSEDAGSIQSKQAASPTASSVNGNTPPTAIGSQTCAGFYPPIALRLNQQGTTTVTVHVTATGIVAGASVKAMSGHEALDAATIRCAMTWTYRPAMRNGTPVAEDVDRTMCWSLEGRTCRPPVPFLPRGAPAGWERDAPFYLAGELASYRLSQMPAAEQYLNAEAYWDFSNLDDFVTSIDANLQRIRPVRVERKERIVLCDGEPASEIEFSGAGLVSADPNRMLNVEQVTAVKDGWGYVSTYTRPAESPKRPDAEQWLRAFCQSSG